MCPAAFDEDAFQDLNQRWGAILDWWMAHRLGPHNDDHIAAVVLEFENVPLEVIIDTLNRCLTRARQTPRSLRYFKVALEEARGAYFRSQSQRTERRGTGARSAGEILAEHPEWYGGQGGAR